jgi:hypothetical protein
MVNSDELISTTQYLTSCARYFYNRVRLHFHFFVDRTLSVGFHAVRVLKQRIVSVFVIATVLSVAAPSLPRPKLRLCHGSPPPRALPLFLCVRKRSAVAGVDQHCCEVEPGRKGRTPGDDSTRLPLLAAPVTFWFGFVAIVTGWVGGRQATLFPCLQQPNHI